MKFKVIILISLIYFNGYSQLPEGFVNVKEVIPDLDIELRYFSSNNFVGETIDGYKSHNLILTREATDALRLVHEELQNFNLCIKVYDGYRPQRAVNHFIAWAKNLNDTVNKEVFYPNIKKKNLIKEGYIATRSGHSRGSTVDLTISSGSTGVALNMGSPYDFFGIESWLDYEDISDSQKANRQLLQDIMNKYGFRNYLKEWWHFTLKEEPFPKTYFNFPIE